MGQQADVANNGIEALEIFKQAPKNHYDLVLMDCEMPEMDGFTATERIREFENDEIHTLIVALTAHVMEDQLDKCRASGMDDYLPKPIDIDKLKSLLVTLYAQP